MASNYTKEELKLLCDIVDETFGTYQETTFIDNLRPLFERRNWIWQDILEHIAMDTLSSHLLVMNYDELPIYMHLMGKRDYLHVILKWRFLIGK